MRKHLKACFTFVLAVTLALGLMPSQAWAARPSSEFGMFMLLNGEPNRIGVIIATTTKNNTDTATPFTITAGSTLKVICDAAAFATVGATASSSYTNAAFGHPMSAGVAWYVIMGSASTTLSIVASSGTANCAVFQML